MRRLLRFVLRWSVRAFLLLVVLLVGAWLLRRPLFEDLLRDEIAALVREETGLELTIGSIEGSWLFDVEVRDVTVDDPSGEHVLASAHVDRVDARWSLGALLSGDDGWIESVEIDGVVAVLFGDALEAGEVDDEPDEPEDESDDSAIPLPASVVVRNVAATVEWEDGRSVELEGLELEGGARSLDDLDAKIRIAGLRGAQGEHAAGLSKFEATLRWTAGDLATEIDFDLLGGHGRITASAHSALDAPRLTGSIALEGIAPPDWMLAAFGTPDVTRVGRFDLTAEFDAVDPDDWRESGSAKGHFEIAEVVARDRTVRRVKLTFDGGATDAGLDLTIDAGELAQVTAKGRAGIDGGVTFDLDVTIPRLDALPIEIEGLAPRGRLEIVGTARGTIDDPVLSGTVTLTNPGWDTVDLDSVVAIGSWAAGRADLKRFEIRRGVDRITLSGAVVVDADGAISVDGIEGDVSIAELADLEPLAELGVSGSVTVDLGADGSIDDPTGHATVNVNDLVVEDRRVDEIELRAALGPGGTVAIESLSVRAPEGTLDLALTGRREEWSALVGSLTKLEVTIAETGDAIGLMNEVEVTVDETGKFSLGETWLVGRGVDVVLDARGEADGRIAGSVSLNGIDLAELVSRFETDVVAAGTLTGSVHVDVDAEGVPTGRVHVALNGGATVTRGERSVELTELKFDARLEADRATLTGGLEADVASVTIDGDVRAADAAVAFLDALPDGLDALRLTADVSVNGRDLTRLPLPDDAPEIETVRIELKAKDRTVDLTTLKVVAAGVTVTGDGSLAQDAAGAWKHSRLKLRIAAPDLATLATIRPDLAGITGSATVDVALNGTPSRPLIRVTVDGKQIGGPEIDDKTDVDLAVRYSSGLARIERGELITTRGRIILSGIAPGTLTLDPLRTTFEPDSAVDVRARTAGEINLATFAPLLTKTAVKSLQGFATFDVRASGPGGEKHSGTLRVRDGRLRLGETRRPIDDIQATLSFEDRRIRLPAISARVGGSKLDVTGHIDFSRRPVVIVVGLKGKRVLLTDAPRIRVRGDIDLTLSTGVPQNGGKPPSGPLVSGRIDRLDVRYTQNIPYVERRPTIAPLPLFTDPEMRKLKLDIDVTSRRIDIDNNLARARLKANLRIGGSAAFPELQGLVFAEEGRVRLPTAVFEIQTTTLDFEATQPLRPLISFRGVTRRSRWTITAVATGRPDNLEIDLISDPPLAREDILSVLATGAPASELSGSGAGESLAFAGGAFLLQRFSWSLRTEEDEEEAAFLTTLVREIPERTEFWTSRDPGSQQTSVEATFRILNWLRLRGESTGDGEVNVDVLFRILGR